MALPAAVVQKLKSLQGDVEGLPIFKELLNRKSRQLIDVYRLRLELHRGGIYFNDLDLYKRFDFLQRAGVGKLTIRKQPAHSSFEWKYDMKDVAAVVLGQPVTPTEIVATLSSPAAGRTLQTTVSQPIKTGQNAVILPLNECIISINGLPANFDTKLVKAISDALMAVARLNESE